MLRPEPQCGSSRATREVELVAIAGTREVFGLNQLVEGPLEESAIRGPGVTRSDLLVINKIDLAPHVGAGHVRRRHAAPIDSRRPRRARVLTSQSALQVDSGPSCPHPTRPPRLLIARFLAGNGAPFGCARASYRTSVLRSIFGGPELAARK